MDDLRLKRLHFENFRSYEAFDLADIGPLTIFVGPNAVGKTNVVEGIQLLTAQTSFRHPQVGQLIRSGADRALIQAQVGGGPRLLDLEVALSEGKKVHRLNGKAKRIADLRGLIPSVAFAPDDLRLVKGSASERRDALDGLGTQLSANHYTILKDYEKVLRSKNRALKEEASPLLIDSLNETAIVVGSALHCYRRALFAKLAQAMSSHYARLVDGRETLSATYVASWDALANPGAVAAPLGGAEAAAPSRAEAEESFRRALAAHRSQEVGRQRSLVGPHADKMHLFVNGLPAESFASQGQQRTIVLAWKLAEVSLVQDVLHQQPVLLLDDVMSELDEARRRALVDFLADDIQTFITTTNLSYFDDSVFERASVVSLGPKAS